MRQLIKISVLFHKFTRLTLLFWLKRISKKFSRFPEKLTLYAKLGRKWFCSDFEVLPSDYLTINQIFNPIPKRTSEKFSSLPEKLTLYAKLLRE